MGTTRQKIIALLKEKKAGAIDISMNVGISEKEVYPHLEHIKKTIRQKGKKLVITPSQCLDCGYVFRKRERFKSPGKCPMCRKTHIQDPTFRIR